MKTKSFAMLAVTGLLTASIAYVAPALAADETNIGSPMEPTLADNSAGTMQSPTDSNGQTQNPSIAPQGDASSDNGNGNTGTSTSSGSTDEGSPDTATGDDDY